MGTELPAIVVTTDLSEQSLKAFGPARELAQALHAHIIVLTIVEDLSQAAMVGAMDFPVLPDPAIQKQVAQRVRSELDKLADGALHGLDYETVVCEAHGPVHAEIVNYVRERGAKYLIISRHGRSGLARMILGSVTAKVAHEAPCPVLIVPEG
ncbi:MAG: universal stress protein [Oligoflexia bacterium]|nr:universal stress protein [Oligoflexia bacterium]